MTSSTKGSETLLRPIGFEYFRSKSAVNIKREPSFVVDLNSAKPIVPIDHSASILNRGCLEIENELNVNSEPRMETNANKSMSVWGKNLPKNSSIAEIIKPCEERISFCDVLKQFLGPDSTERSANVAELYSQSLDKTIGALSSEEFELLSEEFETPTFINHGHKKTTSSTNDASSSSPSVELPRGTNFVMQSIMNSLDQIDQASFDLHNPSIPCTPPRNNAETRNSQQQASQIYKCQSSLFDQSPFKKPVHIATEESSTSNQTACSFNSAPQMQLLQQQQQAQQRLDSTNLYITGFGANFTNEDLENLLDEYKPLTSSRIINGHTEHGIAFARVKSPELAKKAMAELNGRWMTTSKKLLRVKLANKQLSRNASCSKLKI